MSAISGELAALFRRDLTRLRQQLDAFQPYPAALWQVPGPGVTNSAGNLLLHLEGNLREYIGRQLGDIPYNRRRDREFADTGLPPEQLAPRLQQLIETIPAVIGQLTPTQLDAIFPGDPTGQPASIRNVLVHLHGHLTYHMGQIDYLRRLLITGAAAIDYVRS